MGQGQPRVIIWTNYDGPKSPVLHTKFQGNGPFGSREDFWKVFTILDMWLRAFEQSFFPLSQKGFSWNFPSICPEIFQKNVMISEWPWPKVK